jgi:hypothetical protein
MMEATAVVSSLQFIYEIAEKTPYVTLWRMAVSVSAKQKQKQKEWFFWQEHTLCKYL